MSQSIEKLDGNTLFKDGEIVVPDDVVSEGIDPSKLPDNHFVTAGMWHSQHNRPRTGEIPVSPDTPTEVISVEPESTYAEAEQRYWDAFDAISDNYASADLVHAELARRGMEQPKPLEVATETHTPEVLSADALLAIRLQEKLGKANEILDPHQRQSEISRILALERIRKERKGDHAGPAKYGPVHH